MDVSYIKSVDGLILLGEVVLAAIGGIFSIALSGSGFWSFVFWSTVIISLMFLGLHVFKIMPILESKFAFMPKIRLGYVAIWLLFYIISAIISFVTFNLSGILVYILTFLFSVDLFFRYRNYKSGSGADVTAPNAAASAASGGEVPKY